MLISFSGNFGWNWSGTVIFPADSNYGDRIVNEWMISGKTLTQPGYSDKLEVPLGNFNLK